MVTRCTDTNKYLDHNLLQVFFLNDKVQEVEQVWLEYLLFIIIHHKFTDL